MRDNVIGTYLHGPVLAKSPRFADELLRRALRRRGADTDLEPLDDALRRAGGARRRRPAALSACRCRAAAAAPLRAAARGRYGRADRVRSAAQPPPSTSVVTDTVTLDAERIDRSGARPADHCRAAAARRDPCRQGEAEQACPYIASTPQQDRQTNVADIVGQPRLPHHGAHGIAARLGCRFYFYAPPYGAVADIVARTFASALEARNAMVAYRRGRPARQSAQPNLAPGVHGVAYRTEFSRPGRGAGLGRARSLPRRSGCGAHRSARTPRRPRSI